MRRRQSFLLEILYDQKLLSVLGLLLLVLISVPLAKNITRRHKINSEIRELQKEVQNMESKNTDLQQLIKYLESDQFAEEQARLNMGLRKEGEEVAIVKTDGTEPEKGKEESNKQVFNIPGLSKSQSIKISTPQKWKNYFFK